MLAGPHALIRIWVITSFLWLIRIRSRTLLYTPSGMDSFIVSIYYWMFSITHAKFSYEDANSVYMTSWCDGMQRENLANLLTLLRV